jgi:succinyl-CoA synthetase alpha subunit
MEALQFPQLRVIAIIAEGVPENQTRKILKVAQEKGIVIIGPATVSLKLLADFVKLIFIGLRLCPTRVT